ncbi:MAG: MmgE/PrpD family protein [Chloroflexi bacterium]|nr:MmgE/PrpD family protein [Chloroflexota bacterium]
MNSRRVAGFVVETAAEKWPDGVLLRAKTCVMDVLGSALAGLDTKTAQIARQAAAEMGEGRESALWGTGLKVPCASAAFANCVAASVLDIDDGHHKGGHPGAVLIPAALAIGERENATGKRFLEAVVAGYEVQIRANWMFRTSPKHPAQHGAGAPGSYGVAAAASKILGLDEEGVFNALSIAAAHAPIAEAWVIPATGPMTKECIGWGGHTGILAALLARKGFTGSMTILEDQQADGAMLETLGKTYEIMNLYFKPYAACRLTHSAVDILLEIMKEHSLTSKDISRVIVETHKTGTLLNSKRPVTIEQAQYSYPFVLGAALAEGRCGAEQMADGRLSDPAILREVDKVSLANNPVLDPLFPPQGIFANILKVETREGKMYEMRKDYPSGDRLNPLPQEELRAKFRSLASRKLGETGAKKLEAAIDNLESLPRVSELTGVISEMLRITA